MHRALAEAWIKVVRIRASQGDCPDEPALTVEQLEDLAIHFADSLAATEQNLHHWRDECGKLHSQLRTAKGR